MQGYREPSSSKGQSSPFAKHPLHPRATGWPRVISAKSGSSHPLKWADSDGPRLVRFRKPYGAVPCRMSSEEGFITRIWPVELSSRCLRPVVTHCSNSPLPRQPVLGQNLKSHNHLAPVETPMLPGTGLGLLGHPIIRVVGSFLHLPGKAERAGLSLAVRIVGSRSHLGLST